MSRTSPPGFATNVGFAIILSIGGFLAFITLTVLLPGATALRLVTSLSVFIYLLYLLRKSPRRHGRLVLMAVWFMATGAALMIDLGAIKFLALQAALVWLIRCTSRYNHLLPAALDACVVAGGLIFALWALAVTGSVLLTFWCFFLVQSLFTLIPNRALPFAKSDHAHKSRAESGILKHSQQFDRYAHSAQTALAQLIK